jgi:hypothetical protein
MPDDSSIYTVPVGDDVDKANPNTNICDDVDAREQVD